MLDDIDAILKAKTKQSKDLSIRKAKPEQQA